MPRSSSIGVAATRPSDRGPAPVPDRDRLAARYRSDALAAAPDTFVLYRIIGNDLPPRHAVGQSRENLAFILEHEPELPGCEKRFIVNRIVDLREEAAILRMLDDAGYPYVHIPFDREAYRQIGWDVEGVPARYAPFTGRLAASEGPRGRILMRLYRHKNNYVMNNNGARNAALDDGRRRAKWILPWDGNCFITANAWREITDAIKAAPDLPYFIVPMARTTHNAALLDATYRPEATEEPQVIFRRDASLSFDPEYSYGRRPKVELFWRLGVPGKWDDWAIEPWDLPCPPYAEEAGAFGYAGWVARLSSGQVHLESDRDDRAIVDRGLARVEAIAGLIDRLDGEVMREAFDRARLCILEEGRVLAKPLSARLRAAAEEALARGPYSVVDKQSLPPSGDRHDYWHPAPYYWPHPLRLPWLPYVRRDGRRVPGTRLYEPLSERYDRTRLQRLFDDTFVLALASHRLGERRWGEHAARLVRVWFLEPGTAMNPHLEYAQVRRGHDGNRGSSSGIIEMKDLYYFLDGLRLLIAAGHITAEERHGLESWFGRYLDWLRSSPQGWKERAAVNNHGTYYDLQVAAIAAFLGDARLVRETLRDSRSRILQQFDEAGVQPEEMKRPTTAHYCCFNLQGWIHLAMLAESCGEDLWSFEGSDGRGIRKAMHWLLAHAGRDWPYPQLDAFDANRFAPIYHVCVSKYGSPPGPAADKFGAAEEIEPLFFPHDGIMPFWQLGTGPDREGGSIMKHARRSIA